MYKYLIFIGLSLSGNITKAQNNLDYYKAHELNIADLNEPPTESDFDFGFNATPNVINSIQVGYYIWLEDSWYKIENSEKVFKSNKKSPLYFSIDRSNLDNLKLKNPSNEDYTYPIVAIENYKISELIYKTNIDVLNNIEQSGSSIESKTSTAILEYISVGVTDLFESPKFESGNDSKKNEISKSDIENKNTENALTEVISGEIIPDNSKSADNVEIEKKLNIEDPKTETVNKKEITENVLTEVISGDIIPDNSKSADNVEIEKDLNTEDPKTETVNKKEISENASTEVISGDIIPDNSKSANNVEIEKDLNTEDPKSETVNKKEISENALTEVISGEVIPDNSKSADNVEIEKDLNTKDPKTETVNKKEILGLEESEDGTIILPSTLLSKNNEIVENNLNETNQNENKTIKTELSDNSTNETLYINDYEKAVANGFDGTVTEWIESINILGGETAYQRAVNSGYKGDEAEWMRSLWGTNLDPEIQKQDKIASIVSQWISELNSSPGNSPYDLALKNGFYGTYTEWIESVIGKDGEKEFDLDVKNGFKGSYKEWIESKLEISNNDFLRKEKIRKNNFVVVPNLQIPLTDNLYEILQFDLYNYYITYFGNSLISSSNSPINTIQLLNTDLEYQITWFDRNLIEIIEISSQGIIKYRTLKKEETKSTFINIRFLII